MKMNDTGRLIDALGAKREALRKLQVEANAMSKDIRKRIKKTGGGEGAKYLATLVKMEEKTMVVRAHVQVRTFPRSH